MSGRAQATHAGRGTGFDLAVVGGGSAGIVGAKTAASLGASVILIERGRPGGDCLWTGCVPSKALIASADVAATARDAGRFGIAVGSVHVDFGAVMARVQQAIVDIEPTDSIPTLTDAGITVLQGRARFVAGGLLDVDGVTVPYRRALLATGARPTVPPIAGLESIDYLTSDSLWELTTLPERLVVLGGGSIGCELGQAFARLGATVTIVEGLPRILPREDADAAAIIHASLESDGITILIEHRATAVTPVSEGKGTLVLSHGQDTSEVAFDRLLVAVGRTPNTQDLGLDLAGVRLDERGFVVVDSSLRTTSNRIWAAGDLTGHPQFTHVAGVHGSLAASNAVLGLRRRIDPATVPRVTFTDPEVAAVGQPTDPTSAPTGGRRITRTHGEVDRAVTEGRTEGFARLTVDRRRRIIGATVVGPRAGESLAELTLAVRRGLRTRDLAGTIHPYPTYADGPWNAAIADVQEGLASPGMRRATQWLRSLARWRTNEVR
ncbi:MAG: oxidoreductase [Actinomycetales bacterium]|nr:oxidoreductase [Actinomycetales bacterium]